MPKKSAGILLYRFTKDILEVFLVHPGGPLWANKDAGAWSVPKGEFDEGEDILAAAQREFFEETGKEISGEFIPLAPVKQKSGKTVHAFALESDFDGSNIASNNFSMEWPPRSGLQKEFPEIDKGEWFDLVSAREKINAGQIPLLDELEEKLKSN
jgi:predicted NUDIX family NTP pyrophosphohydrolase